MRILYLSKRQYMGHDVIVDLYARLYEQPHQLAQLGNEVLGVCLSYRNCSIKDEIHPTNKGSLRWIGFSAGKLRLKISSYPTQLLDIASQFKPDIIVGASDCLHIILGQWIANKIGCIYAADLYDDFESFPLAKIPYVKRLYRKALKKAKVISCVSQSLSAHIKQYVDPQTVILALPSTINKSIFYPRDKNEMRRKLDLPVDVRIIGTAGGLYSEKGIDIVYAAFQEIVFKLSNVICVLAGPFDDKYPPPKHDRIIYLGKLPHDKVADLFGALDVGIIYLKDTQYGRLSFPQKAYEMAACGLPVVAANVGDLNNIFSSSNNELYNASDKDSLAQAILKQLEAPYSNNVQMDNWCELAMKMLNAYSTVQKDIFNRR